MNAITSMQNPLIQAMRALKDAKGRRAQGVFLVEGAKQVWEALGAGMTIRDALIDQAKADKLDALAQALSGAGANVCLVPEHILCAVCDTVTPSGVCVSALPPPPLDLERPPNLLVALDAVADPANVGTIWRTADAAGFSGVIAGAGSCEMLSPKVVRGAMGSAFRVPTCQVASLQHALSALKLQGYQLIATTLDGEDIYGRRALGDRLVLVIGNESRGVSPEVAQIADARLKLPMRGGAESLNAAVAAGICMYELTREMQSK